MNGKPPSYLTRLGERALAFAEGRGSFTKAEACEALSIDAAAFADLVDFIWEALPQAGHYGVRDDALTDLIETWCFEQQEAQSTKDSD
jgi:hypothetical protein